MRLLHSFLIVLVTALVSLPSSNASAQQQVLYAQDAVFAPTIARNGMVVSEEAIASQVGADILKRGGNAVDAAVAVGFALAVVLPEAGNLGGGGFMLVHLREQNKTVAIDYRETAPAAATRDMFVQANGEVDSDALNFGYTGVGVPGSVAGLTHALARYGTMKLSDVIAPAIKLASAGFILKPSHENTLRNAQERLGRNESSRKIFLKADGSVPRFGERLVQKDLAWSLTQIAGDGAKAFYEGAIGARLIADIQAHGGVMMRADLKNYRVIEREPVHGTYRGYDIFSMPPPSSGGVHLIEILNVLEGYPLAEWGQNSAAAMHVMIEAERRAYADRSKYLGDPDFVSVPVAQLTSKKYADDLRKQISLERATPSSEVAPGNLAPYESTQTTHFSVIDRWGNAVSNTYTLNYGYGSGITAAGTGILLNNEMDDFSAKPGAPNAYGLVGAEANAVGPRKRPLSSMTPTLVFKDGKLLMATGSPGGSTIITVVLQTIVNVIDYQQNIASAVSAPRFHHQWQPDNVRVEQGISLDTIALLRAKGHDVQIGRPLGRCESIMWDSGLFYGAVDPRARSGGAAGF